MKTSTQLKFDKIIKEGFYDILKPLNFKKNAQNFYRNLGDLGQIINIQKSKYGTKDQVRFTINTGIFVPEYWIACFNFQNKELPSFPIEPECLIRKRIGDLMNQNDTWYNLDSNMDENILINEMHNNLNLVILPYFSSLKTKSDLVVAIENESIIIPGLAKVIIYSEYELKDKAKIEYEKLLSDKNTKPYHMESILEYGHKYGL
jgi:hypothetical protein